jgi:hypothetical protein
MRKFLNSLTTSESFFEWMELVGLYLVLISLRLEFVDSLMLALAIVTWGAAKRGRRHIYRSKGKMVRVTGVMMGNLEKGTIRINHLYVKYGNDRNEVQVEGVWTKDK